MSLEDRFTVSAKACNQPLTCDPRHVGGICPGEPVRSHEVIKPDGIQADLEGTEMQCPLRPGRVVIVGGLGEERRGAVPSSLG